MERSAETVMIPRGTVPPILQGDPAPPHAPASTSRKSSLAPSSFTTATALTIMGSAEAMVLAEERGLAVYLLKRSGDTLEAFSSTAMAQWMPEEGS